MAFAASSADMAHLPSAAVGHAISMTQCSDAAAIAEEVFDKFDKVAAPRWTALENWAVFDSGMQAADATTAAAPAAPSSTSSTSRSSSSSSCSSTFRVDRLTVSRRGRYSSCPHVRLSCVGSVSAASGRHRSVPLPRRSTDSRSSRSVFIVTSRSTLVRRRYEPGRVQARHAWATSRSARATSSASKASSRASTSTSRAAWISC